MPSHLFDSEAVTATKTAIGRLVRDHESFLSETTARSPRAVGDALQDIIARGWLQIMPDAQDVSLEGGRRAMGDLTFADRDGFEHVVDVKTHRADASFSMPNLTSVDRLDRLYRNRGTYFDILLVRYAVDGATISIGEIEFAPIEWLSWDCLTLGALGRGQIQIKNSRRIDIRVGQSRQAWMSELMRRLTHSFYPREVEKLQERVRHFSTSLTFWEGEDGRNMEP